MTKKCPMCGQELPLDQFYRRRNGDGVNVYCKRCAIEQTVRRQRLLKAHAIAFKGGACQICGYSRCDGAMEFHHRDPGEKDFTISHIGTTDFEKVKAEVEKCDLLCANCHREAHSRLPRKKMSSLPLSSSVERKVCACCQELLPLSSFNRRRSKAGACSYCKQCAYEVALKRQRRLKQQAVDYKGACCKRCGYDRYSGALEFHHRDRSQKDFSLGQVKLRRFELVKAELDKCDLLCVNCHREAHADTTVC